METDDVVEELVDDDQGSVGGAGFDQMDHLGRAVRQRNTTVITLTIEQCGPVHAGASFWGRSSGHPTHSNSDYG